MFPGRPFDVLLNQVGVDSDRGRRSGASRRDHLSARIDHVPGGPDTDGAGQAGGIDGHEASLVDLARQPCEQAIGMRRVAGPDEYSRPLDHPTGGQLDAGQPVVLDHQPRDLAANDPHPACLELGLFSFGQVVGVDEEGHVVRPLPHQLRVLD